MQRSPTRGDIEGTVFGLDVHAASCTLSVISQAGKRLTDFPIETNGHALVEAIRRIPGRKHLVFEEGIQSAWLYETPSPHIDEIVVAGIPPSRGQKSDRRDAYGLAEKLRTGALAKRIFKAPREFSALRELSRMHITLAHEVVRFQARIKSRYRSRHREKWQPGFLVDQKKQIERDLLREAKKHPIVATPHRFRTKRQFWSDCGLGIVMRSSSDRVQKADGVGNQAESRQADRGALGVESLRPPTEEAPCRDRSRAIESSTARR